MRVLTTEELDALYGGKKVAVGRAFIGDNGHLYLQRKNDVLHVGTSGIINTLHVGFFNRAEDLGLSEITEKEFSDGLRKTIFELEIDKYWTNA